MPTTKKFDVIGMHCASCASIIKRKLAKVPGVEKIDVNFATEKAHLTTSNNLELSKLNAVISPLGYSLKSDSPTAVEDNPPMGMAGHNMSKMASPEKPAVLAGLRQKTLFVMPIAIIMFTLMIWDLLSSQFHLLPELPISMMLLN